MKRLFAIGENYFPDKQKAKAFRAANGGRVSIGPDHWRFEFKNAPKSHIGSRAGEFPGDGFPKRKRK